LRAVHQLVGEEPKILDDPVIVRMLDEMTVRRIQTHPDAYLIPHRRALLSNVLIRSRYAEDHLAEAVAQGIKQYVILGAGLDTFAYRQPKWAETLQFLNWIILSASRRSATGWQPPKFPSLKT
jgi:O-methyltransferase involved in polyketide biosynthesis